MFKTPAHFFLDGKRLATFLKKLNYIIDRGFRISEIDETLPRIGMSAG